MITKILQAIFSVPFFYNQMQIFFGSNVKKGLVKKHYTFLSSQAVILDLGGGTGLYRDLWPKNYKYICLDNDTTKLNGFLKNHPGDTGLFADAARIPLKDKSVHVVFCSSMSHHLTQDVLMTVLAEGARVLHPDGKFMFLDAVLRQESPLNRFLWSLDRGEHPHTEDVLLSCFQKYFNVETFEKFSRYYDFIFMAGSRRS
jgi:ubiquinone/menaquinone biosynthesis C-methylase UbiE